MDFNNGLYVFNGVPGLEASKGERVTKALQNLQNKIKHLEQVRNSERETSSKSGSTDEEDITLSDVRLKLLFLQLQYMRVKLRSTRDDDTEDTADESEHQRENSESEYCEIPNCTKETQTGKSLHELMPTVPKPTASHTKETPTVPAKRAPTSTAGTISDHDQLPSKSIPPSSTDGSYHYHLKIDDVPFILAASGFQSHNLIANVQDLIAKMKTHNKALCGSRFQAPRNIPSSPIEKNCLYAKKMIKEISKDVTEIEVKQAKVIESLDNEEPNLFDRIPTKETPHHEAAADQKQTKKPSNTDSGATAVRPKESKQQLKSTRVIKKSKHAVPTNKIRPNLPQVTRQRFLRSIKAFRTQLSEEDISWV